MQSRLPLPAGAHCAVMHLGHMAERHMLSQTTFLTAHPVVE